MPNWEAHIRAPHGWERGLLKMLPSDTEGVVGGIVWHSVHFPVGLGLYPSRAAR